MLAGYPPFYDEDPIKTYGKIMSGTITFPMHFSKQAMDLIRKLLNPKARTRASGWTDRERRCCVTARGCEVHVTGHADNTHSFTLWLFH